MRVYVLICFFSIVSSALFGQNNDTWTAFWNNDTTLTGFKDKNGKVMIEPQFMGITIANKFDKVIAVMEEVNGGYKSYYLTKSGRIIGKDSLYIFDNGADCESEGFIRFRDRKTDKVGMFNRNGDIVIPAEYNDLSRVINGMVTGLKGAEKESWDKGKTSDCDHSGWSGGKVVLIDTSNKVLIDDFNYDNNINFYSIIISGQSNPDTIRENFIGTDGKYYSFIDFKKEFNAWLKNVLLRNFSKENLLTSTYKDVKYWKEPDGWISEVKSIFIDRNFELIKSKLLELNLANCEYAVFDEGLNPYIFRSEEFNEYYTNCGESKDWIYPVKDIVITHKEKKDFSQDHFGFLRTDNGYKLISISVREGELK